VGAVIDRLATDAPSYCHSRTHSASCMVLSLLFLFFFFFNDPATTEIYTLSLHDALPISDADRGPIGGEIRHRGHVAPRGRHLRRSEEHTSELQSRSDLVCRLLLEKKKKKKLNTQHT